MIQEQIRNSEFGIRKLVYRDLNSTLRIPHSAFLYGSGP
jgi:hypothetical protein